MVIESLVKTVLTELKTISQSETVIGDPIEVGEIMLVPVSKVTMGFAIGGGQAKPNQTNGEGTGGGISIEPQAFIAVHGSDVKLISMQSDQTTLGKIIDLIPEVGKKIQTVMHKKEETSEETDGAHE